MTSAATAFYSGGRNGDAQGQRLASDLKDGKALVFPTKVYCCKPGVGAHADGCN